MAKKTVETVGRENDQAHFRGGAKQRVSVWNYELSVRRREDGVLVISFFGTKPVEVPDLVALAKAALKKLNATKAVWENTQAIIALA